jgi:hypothetical protein
MFVNFGFPNDQPIFEMVEGVNAAVSEWHADAGQADGVHGEVLLAPLHPPVVESSPEDG